MKKMFLLAVTSVLLAGPAAFATGGKQKSCAHCTKQNCTGQKCATCCSHGQCKKK